MDADERLEPREGMGEGQEEKVHVTFGDTGGLGRRLQSGDVVAVRLHHTLGRPRGARGVHDGGDIVGGGVRHPRGQLGLERLTPLPSHAPQRLPGEQARRGLLALVALDDDDLLEPGHGRVDFEDFGKLARILDDESLHPRIVDDVLDEIGRIGRVDRDGDAPGRENGEVGLHPLGAAGRENAHRLAAAAAEGHEPGGDLAHDFSHFAPGQGLPRSALLELLGGLVSAQLHPIPEHACQCLISHDPSPSRRCVGLSSQVLAQDLSDRALR